MTLPFAEPIKIKRIGSGNGKKELKHDKTVNANAIYNSLKSMLAFNLTPSEINIVQKCSTSSELNILILEHRTVSLKNLNINITHSWPKSNC